MKKLLASLVAVLTLLPAQATSADILNLSAGVFPQDELTALSSSGNSFAVGGGSVGTLRFAFSAQCKSAFGFCPEPPPSGYAVVRHPTLGEAQGHVCGYSASDISNEASFVIEVEKGSGTLGSFPFVLFDAGDFQGEPPTGTFPPDQLAVAEATGCRSAGLLVFVGFVDQGNIVVKNR